MAFLYPWTSQWQHWGHRQWKTRQLSRLTEFYSYMFTHSCWGHLQSTAPVTSETGYLRRVVTACVDCTELTYEKTNIQTLINNVFPSVAGLYEMNITSDTHRHKCPPPPHTTHTQITSYVRARAASLLVQYMHRPTVYMYTVCVCVLVWVCVA